ncbi:MAG: HAD hydrolase-like protein [Clostridia bacterium]
MKKYKYLFFDFDGTLTDTFEGVAKILDMTFAKYGKNIDRKNYSKFIGPPLSDTFAELFGKELVAESVEFFKQNYMREKAIYMTKVYDGMELCLKTLQEQNFVVGVATCKIQEEADELLDYFNLKKYIDFVSGLCYTVREQKCDILQYAIDNLGANKDECLMIGDTIFDVDGAQKVGVDCILCLWGFGDFEKIDNDNVVFRAEKPMDIVDFLNCD